MPFKAIYIFVFALFFALWGSKVHAQSISNEGMEFWTVFASHDPSGANLATLNLNITSKNESEVTVTCGNWSSGKVRVLANQVTTILVDRSASYIEQNDGNKNISNKAIHIVVTPGKPKVVAYGHVFASARSAASLILPVESLGQKYYSMNYTQDLSANAQNYLVLVAVEDNTKLKLHKKDGTMELIDLPKKGDVYEYISTLKEDFTGVFVEVDESSSCKRFAAFSGVTSIAIGCSASRDPLFQQLYAVNSWGKRYGLVPFEGRRYLFRVVAQESNTTVKVDNKVVRILNAGQYYESDYLTEGTMVSADKLISVAQYTLTQVCSSNVGSEIIGDPEMVLVNPIEFNIKSITVFSSSRQAIVDKFINVFMKTDKIASFRLNGAMPSVTWRPMSADSLYSYAQIPVFYESLTLTAEEGFNAIAYGFGSFESYAYSAGTNLYSTSTLDLVNVQSGLKSTTAACVGQPTRPTLTLPYRLTQITWQFDDGSAPIIDKVLSGSSSFVDQNGTLLYTYTYPSVKQFTELGTSQLKAYGIISDKDRPECFVGDEMEFTFQFEVVPLGAAAFDIPEICAGKAAQFFDKSTIASGSVTRWKWEFDGVIKTEQNPFHTFETLGTHTVKLSVANADGCWSDVYSTTINVNRYFPQLEFSKIEPICIDGGSKQFVVEEKRNLKFKKREFSGNGVSVDGFFDPVKAGVGKHTITYTFTSDLECTDVVTQEIEVYATTVLDAPTTVYVLSGGERKIDAKITNPDPNYKYRYKWSPSVGLSDDSIIDPIASPNTDTQYTLIVSIDGFCDVKKEVLVKVLDKVSPPNAFSPNGDGVNDVWVIPSLDSYPMSETVIFNRSGQRVFYSKGYTVPFDGNFEGKPLPVGVYYYRINPNNGRGMLSGSLTIIR